MKRSALLRTQKVDAKKEGFVEIGNILDGGPYPFESARIGGIGKDLNARGPCKTKSVRLYDV